MQYLLLMKERGEGCDYTIGCGMMWEYVELDETDFNKAVKILEQKMAYRDGPDTFYFDDYSESFMESVTVIQVADKGEMDLSGLREEYAAKKEAEEETDLGAAELLEYKRLKDKFGDK